jgi:protein SCO1/2
MNMSVKNISGVLTLAATVLIGTSARGDEAGVKRSMAQYTVPQVQLVRDDNKKVMLPDEFKDGQPAVVTFIFTTCNSICPLISQTLAKLQEGLGADRNRVHIMSISIDPEEDTPARLAAYAKELHAGPEWHHYTGTVQAINAAERAFNVYRGDKMGHTPVILLRPAPGKPWIRFDGFATASQLLSEIRRQNAASK